MGVQRRCLYEKDKSGYNETYMKIRGSVGSIVGAFLFIALAVASGFRYALVQHVPIVEKMKLVPQVISTPMSTPIFTPMPTPKYPTPPVIPGEHGIKVPVLLYHYISENPNKDDKVRTGLSTPPGVFEQQLHTLLTNGFTSITFDELAAALSGKFILPTRPVILTFDDGYADFYTNAYPLLQKYHTKGVVFIPTGLLGGGNYMTWSQLEEVSMSPFVAVGAHSIHHYALTKIASDVLKKEVEDSKYMLEKHVGYTINWFAYPYGAFNTVVVNMVKQAGYIGAITTLSGSWQYQSHFFYIPRYRAGRRMGNDLLRLLL